jgi:transposase
MQVKGGKPPRSARLKRVGVELSREAQVRLSWMDFYRETDNAALTCRHFGISRQTFYRWHGRYNPMDLTSLESGSHRPRRCRRPTWSFPLEDKVLTLRLQFPRWGKDKLAVLLRRQGQEVSTSMVGRILVHLKRGGRLVEAPRTGVKGSRRALRVRPYAVRKPKQYAVSAPGDLVQVDTMDVRPVPGTVFKQFTARDLVSRWDVVQAHTRASAQCATEFLDTLAHRHALSPPRPAGRWRIGVRGRVRAGLPAARPAPVRAAAPFAQDQRLGRACQSHPHRGVLSGHPLLPGTAQAEPRTA